MRILIINSRYFPAAGPEKYLFSVSEMLESRGHEVIPFSLKHSRNLPTPYSHYFAENIGGGDDLYYEEMGASLWKKLQLVERQFYSVSVKKSLDRLIDATEPDVAYILHYQNRLSPSVISACKQRGVPTVVRISDFSLVCIRNNLLRNGAVCELCLSNGLHHGVLKRCVKDSLAGSAVKAAALKFHRTKGTYDSVARFVVPSCFTITKLERVLDPGRLVYIPTLVECPSPRLHRMGDYALFVGRVEEEKGLSHLIEAFAGTNYPLKIVGYSHSGYVQHLKRQVNRLGANNVAFLGPMFGAELAHIYERSRFLVAPVLWYENLPNVVLEAMSYGKAVIGSDIGSMREVIQSDVTGVLVRPGSVAELRRGVKELFEDDDKCQQLGTNALQRVRDYYSPNKHYDKLMALFQEII